MSSSSIARIGIFVPALPTTTYRNAFSMFIDIFGCRSKSSSSSTEENNGIYRRKGSVGQKSVRFNTSHVVFYTHSKTDYDRGGMSFDDSADLPKTLYVKHDSSNIRRPVLDSDDEDDSLDVDLISLPRSNRRHGSSFRLLGKMLLAEKVT